MSFLKIDSFAYSTLKKLRKFVYLETDYRQLTKKLFIEHLLNYSTFLFQNQLRNQVQAISYEKLAQKQLASMKNKNSQQFQQIQEPGYQRQKIGKNKLNNQPLHLTDWKFYKIQTLFIIQGVTTTTLSHIQEQLEKGEIASGLSPHCSSQTTNNGISSFYNFTTEKENVLTFESTVTGFCTYQPLDFSATGDVKKLEPLFLLNPYRALFFVTLLSLEISRYNYGRKSTRSRMLTTQIPLPSVPRTFDPEKQDLLDTTGHYQPDFDFIENFIKNLPYSSSLEVENFNVNEGELD